MKSLLIFGMGLLVGASTRFLPPLASHVHIPERQIETSVVLANPPLQAGA
jgi:hypothetical protein